MAGEKTSAEAVVRASQQENPSLELLLTLREKMSDIQLNDSCEEQST